jgi:hypothetical protein
MGPLLVSALVGLGVKIASDLMMAGAKQIFKPGGSATSFAATLDKARGDAPAAPAATNGPKPLSLEPAGVDRARVLTAEAASGLPSASRGQVVATYQRLDDIPPQAV